MSLGSNDSATANFVRNDGRHVINFDNVYDNPQGFTITRSPKTELPCGGKTAEVISIKVSVRDSRDIKRVSATLVEDGHAIQVLQPLVSFADLQHEDLDEMNHGWEGGEELMEVQRERTTAAAYYGNKNQLRSTVLAFGPTNDMIKCTTQHFNDGCEGTEVKKQKCFWTLYGDLEDLGLDPCAMVEVQWKVVVDGTIELTRKVADDDGMADLTAMADRMNLRKQARRAERARAAANGMQN